MRRTLILALTFAFVLCAGGCFEGYTAIKPPICQPPASPCLYVVMWSDPSGATIYVEASKVQIQKPPIPPAGVDYWRLKGKKERHASK